MDLFDLLTMLWGLSLFLFGMSVMGEALERRAGSSLRVLLRKLTTGRIAGLLTGLGVTAVIQSSSATTVMVVGFVNSGLMTLRQAIHVIMGANIGTTVTAWILSLSGLQGDSLFVKLLKPTSFSPVLAVIGIVCYLFLKDEKSKDTGAVLLGFSTLMFGMDAMSDAVAGLADVPAFGQMFLLFENPVMGVLAGAVLTAIIQSSSASVGILQALSATGQVSFGAAIPIIMGQNIGTCITAKLSSVGTNVNARRAANVHLMFNCIGTAVCLAGFMLVDALFSPALFEVAASEVLIAVAHSAFNVFCTLLLLPLTGMLEQLANRMLPDEPKSGYAFEELDERLLATPPLALERCRMLTADMIEASRDTLHSALTALQQGLTPELARTVRENEKKTDHYEDALGDYLVRLSTQHVSEADSIEAAGILKLIGDFERIADHGLNLLESAEELENKEIALTEQAKAELAVLTKAVSEVLELACRAYLEGNIDAAASVEPLEEVVDALKESLRSRHIARLQKGICSIEAGFVWADLLNSLERISDHCSNVAACVLDTAHQHMTPHEALRTLRRDDHAFADRCRVYEEKYALPAIS